MNINYKETAELLSECLNPAQQPLALCLLENPPVDVPRYKGRVAAGCAFWEEGARSGFVTSPADHSLCAIGVHTHNLEAGPEQQSELETALRIFSDLGYLRPADLPGVPVLKSRPKHVLYVPLAEAPVTPDAVLLFVNAPAALIVSEACQQVEGGNPPAMGRPACAAIPQVINTGLAAYSLGCCGARAYLDVLSENVALYVLPGANLGPYAERIRILSEANTLLSKFHRLRKSDVAAGKNPSIAESLATLHGAP